jgi:hypothetical protein
LAVAQARGVRVVQAVEDRPAIQIQDLAFGHL